MVLYPFSKSMVVETRSEKLTRAAFLSTDSLFSVDLLPKPMFAFKNVLGP